jgi:PIN domain nuclease of toxin-antitoxin system
VGSVELILLDTHAWLWWASDPARLSPAARDACVSADEVGVCAMSCWEVGMLANAGRITLDRPVAAWVARALSSPRAVFVETSWRAAVAAADLGDRGFHGDPADRLIYATAQDLRCQLVSRDDRMRCFDAAVVW